MKEKRKEMQEKAKKEEELQESHKNHRIQQDKEFDDVMEMLKNHIEHKSNINSRN